MLFKKNNKKDEPVKLHSSRGESLSEENKINDSVTQFEEIKKIHENEVNAVLFEREVKLREKEAQIEKKQTFIQKTNEILEKETSEFERRMELQEKVNSKKRHELKKRDIAYRNRSILG